jgi:hypothetical protein
MGKEAVHILKGQEVKLEGQVQLELLRAKPSLMKEEGASSTLRARMIENRPEFATIEITCSCGTTIYLRCEYAAAKTSDGGPDPAINVQPNKAQGE